MRYHAQRIRRIQQLCAQLDHTIRDSHLVQETVEQLRAESSRLLQDLREPPRPKEPTSTARKRAARPRTAGPAE